MKAMCLTMVSICAFTQASLAMKDDKEIVDKITKEANGSIAQRCGPLMDLVESDKEALDRILTVEANALQNENADPVERRRFGMTMTVQELPADKEILEITNDCPAFQKKYRYMVSGRSHKLLSDKTQNANESVQKEIQSLKEQVNILEGRVDSLTKAMKR